MGEYVLNIAHMYPDLLNLYGDRGNVLALLRRAQGRGIEVNVRAYSIGDSISEKDVDLVFIGGGQDSEQNIMKDDLIKEKGPIIKQMIEDGVVFLCVCGGYQMLGKYYETYDNKQIQCLGALDYYTKGAQVRFIQDTIYEYDGILKDGKPLTVIGFENHSGRTILGDGVQPLFKVVKGAGNNGQDGFEGGTYKNVFCTYSHGSFLPKNPKITDMLLEKALSRKYGESFKLLPLDSEFETIAAKEALKYVQKST